MADAEAYFDRLRVAAADSIERDGQRWYPAWQVCTALQLNYDRTLKAVRPADKITLRRQRRYVLENVTYFSRRGVEAAIMLKGGLPRGRMLEALA